MQNVILSDIRAEYQHNISQQIYVTDTSWHVVKKMKDETIGMIHNAVTGLPDTASSVELSKVILTHLANLEDENPYEKALEIVKQEVQKTL
jgi:phosphoribosyl 1,2-cyclic phosphodiesterase